MKIFLVIALLFIVGCKKQARDNPAPLNDVVLENKTKDEEVMRRAMERRKKCPPNNPNCQNPPPPPTETKGCILYDFDGQLVSGTLWNTSGDFYCQPAGNVDMADILTKSRLYYAFNPTINITTDEAVFNTYPINKRARIIITTSTDVFGSGIGGIAYINSFNWYDDTPAFVFSSSLGFNSKNIADASSHEAGHTLNLRHQSAWQYNEDGSCYKISEYLWGDLIMGASYNSANPRFGIGPNSLGCYVIQNDTLIINQSVRL